MATHIYRTIKTMNDVIETGINAPASPAARRKVDVYLARLDDGPVLWAVMGHKAITLSFNLNGL